MHLYRIRQSVKVMVRGQIRMNLSCYRAAMMEMTQPGCLHQKNRNPLKKMTLKEILLMETIMNGRQILMNTMRRK